MPRISQTPTTVPSPLSVTHSPSTTSSAAAVSRSQTTVDLHTPCTWVDDTSSDDYLPARVEERNYQPQGELDVAQHDHDAAEHPVAEHPAVEHAALEHDDVVADDDDFHWNLSDYTDVDAVSQSTPSNRDENVRISRVS
ncbi:hypothetical protein FOZ62_003565, partial [Perkinsus olseni]